MRTEIEKELDRVEEYVLNKIFGDINNPRISQNMKMLMTLKGINFNECVNEKILIFEAFMKNFMREDGFLDTEKINKMVSIQIPILEGLNLPVARPIEYIKFLELFIPLEKLGSLLERF